MGNFCIFSQMFPFFSQSGRKTQNFLAIFLSSASTLFVGWRDRERGAAESQLSFPLITASQNPIEQYAHIIYKHIHIR